MTIRGSLVLRGRVTIPEPPMIEAGFRLRGRVHVPSRGMRRRVVLVDTDGVPLDGGFLDQARMGPVTPAPAVSKPSRGTFRMSAIDPKVANVKAQKYREVQFWIGSRCVLFGPIVDQRFDGGTWEFTAEGAASIPCRRTVGPAVVRSLLGDGSFQTDMGGWTPAVTGPEGSYTAPDANCYVERVRHPQLQGKWAVHLHDSSDVAPEDDRQPVMYKDYLIVPGAFDREFRVFAQYMVSSLDFPNSRKAGLILYRLPVTSTDVYNDAIDVQVGSPGIDHDTPLGIIRPIRCGIKIPPATPARIRAQVEGPVGDAYVTNIWGEYDEGLEFSGEDQADIFFKACDHLTGSTTSPYTFARTHPNYPYETSGYGKSDAKIKVDAPATGKTVSRQYMFNQHRNGQQVLGDFDHDDSTGLEWAERFTATTRTIFTASPKIGDYRPDCVLRWSAAGGNVASFAYSFLGEQGANSILVMPPSGAWRPGAAIDPGDFANGLTLEDVLQAPVDLPREGVDRVADQRLASALEPIALAVKFRADPFWTDRGVVDGDRLPVVFRFGTSDLIRTMWIRGLGITEDDWIEAAMIPWAAESL